MSKSAAKIYAYVGTMGAGKTKKLVSLYNKFISEGKNVAVFKHVNDVQRGGHVDAVVARNGDTAPATAIESLCEILGTVLSGELDAVLIDEIQFFDDEDTLLTIELAASLGTDVYVFGLDITSDMETFGPMGDILALADEVKKLKAKCHICGRHARISAYVGTEEKEGAVKVGDIGDYQPTCRDCFHFSGKFSNKFTSPVNPTEEAGELVSEDDEFYELTFDFEDLGAEIGVYKSSLEQAGYTYEDVKDINSSEGLTNLLKDLGYI